MQFSRLISTVLVVGLGSGCASMFVSGGKLADHDYATDSKAKYEARTCTDVATGKTGDGSTAVYHVVSEQGQPALFERNDEGKGVVITNRWSAEDGVHYFTSVHSTGARKGDGLFTGLFRSSRDTGWEYVVPPEGTGTRLVYNDCKIATGADGVAKPTSTPSIKCVLTPL